MIRVVKFEAKWCAPCRALKPLFKKFAAAHPEVECVVVDCDKDGEIAEHHKIKALPTVLFLASVPGTGSWREVARVVGMGPNPMADLERALVVAQLVPASLPKAAKGKPAKAKAAKGKKR